MHRISGDGESTEGAVSVRLTFLMELGSVLSFSGDLRRELKVE